MKTNLLMQVEEFYFVKLGEQTGGRSVKAIFPTRRYFIQLY